MSNTPNTSTANADVTRYTVPSTPKIAASDAPTAEPEEKTPVPVLMIDSREPIEIPPALTELGIPNKRRQLQVGDFWFRSIQDEMIVVTRKSSDLMSSLYDGHFQDELARCIEFIHSSGGGRLIYLQEGVWAPNMGGGLAYFKRAGHQYFRRTMETGGSSKALVGTQLSLQAAGLWICQTGDLHETIAALAAIYNRANEGWPSSLIRRPSRPALRWSEDGRVANLRGLWPKLREDVAEDLLKRHGSIRAVIDYVLGDPKAAVKNTPHLGKTGANNLIKVMND